MPTVIRLVTRKTRPVADVGTSIYAEWKQQTWQKEKSVKNKIYKINKYANLICNIVKLVSICIVNQFRIGSYSYTIQRGKKWKSANLADATRHQLLISQVYDVNWWQEERWTSKWKLSKCYNIVKKIAVISGHEIHVILGKYNHTIIISIVIML